MYLSVNLLMRFSSEYTCIYSLWMDFSLSRYILFLGVMPFHNRYVYVCAINFEPLNLLNTICQYMVSQMFFRSVLNLILYAFFEPVAIIHIAQSKALINYLRPL